MARTTRTSRAAALQEIWEGFHAFKRGFAGTHRPAMHGLHALTPTQWLTLETVARKDGMPIKDLRQALGVSSSAATQAVNELEKSGYVVRETKADDRRLTLVVLSPKARRVREKIRLQMLARLEEMFSVLSDAEFATYRRLHSKLIRALIT